RGQERLVSRTRTGSWRVPSVVSAMFAAVPACVGLAATPAFPARSQCMEPMAATAKLIDRTVQLAGNEQLRIDLPTTSRSDLFVYAMERGIDVVLEARDAADVSVAM